MKNINKVYREFDQVTLDREYSIRFTVPSIDPFLADYARLSAEARSMCKCLEDVSYGQHPDEILDIFPAGVNAPVFVYFHGGYWRMLSQKESSFMAPCFVKQGVATVAVNYSLAPGASIDTIVRQCHDAIGWIWHNARDFGGDPNRIYVCGSSAGGHLTGMMVSGGWQPKRKLPLNVVKGGVPLSGLHDLEPIRLSNINEWIQMDEAAVRRNSPIHNLPDFGCPLIISFGASETSEFKRQSRILYKAWQRMDWSVESFEHDTRNHFDLVFDLCDETSLLGLKVFNMIKG